MTLKKNTKLKKKQFSNRKGIKSSESRIFSKRNDSKSG